MRTANFGASLTLIATIFLLTLVQIAAVNAEELKVATLNIRGAPRKQPKAPPQGSEEYPWTTRRDPLIAQVLDQAPDVIGFQEVRAHQLKDLVRGLKGEYDYVAQETGGKNDVSNPVFFRKEKIALVKVDFWWLSQTPRKASKGWDANMYRLVTQARLRLKKGGEAFVFANTHLDPRGTESRPASATLIRERLVPLSKKGNKNKEPLVFLVGDLNSTPETDAYRILAGSGTGDGAFIDARRAAGDNSSKPTYHGFLSNSTSGISDYILVANNAAIKKGRWSIAGSGIVSDKARAGSKEIRISDHASVWAGLEK